MPHPLPEVLEASILRLQPGDALVLTVDGDITQQQANDVKEAVNRALPDVPCLVVTDSVTLQIVRDESQRKQVAP